MAAIPSTMTDGQTVTAALFNAAGKALSGMGITDDNGGFPIAPIALLPGIPLSLGASAEVGKAFAGAGTFTVTAGKWFVITNIFHAASVTDTVTPSGGAAFTYANAAVTVASGVQWVLGPGDAITLGAGSSCSGTLLTAPAGLARIFQTVSNTVTFTVPALRRVFLTGAAAAASSAGIDLQIDGVAGIRAVPLDSSAGGAANVVRPVVVGAAQVLASSSATLVLISGIQYVVAT